MVEYLKKCCAGLVKAAAFALLRHFLTLAGGAVVTWLIAHHADATQAQSFVEYLGGAVLTGAGMAWGQKDVFSVGTKVKVAAVTAYDQGVEAQQTTDESRREAVATAIAAADKAAPKTKAALLASLNAP